MKSLIKICLALILGLVGVMPSIAQTEVVKKKLAVYVTGEDVENRIKKVFNSKLATAITSSGQYRLVETSPEFLTALQREMDRQTSGEVRSSQIAALGQKYGVKLVVVADITDFDDELFVTARSINLETGEVGRNVDKSGAGESLRNIEALAQQVAAAILGASSRGSVGGGNFSSSSGGGNVETFNVNGVSFDMVRVDGGSYQMGSYSGDSDEQPVHSEYVGTFYIGKTEVTQALWAAVMGNNPSSFRGDTRPVENVSWYDCQEFVERLSRLTGRVFRLPTEAEWEFAARGGTRSRGYTYSGSDDVYRVAWYTENSGSTTHPVAQKLDNELGIYDMSGNVWEWCSDNYSSNYSSPRNSSFRVGRGGSWCNAALLTVALLVASIIRRVAAAMALACGSLFRLHSDNPIL